MDKWIRLVQKTKSKGLECLKTRFRVMYDVDVEAGTNDGDGDQKETYIKLSADSDSLTHFKVSENEDKRELEIYIHGECEHEEILSAIQFALDAIACIQDGEVLEPDI